MTSLFDELGGEPAMEAAVDIFYRKVLSDERIAHFFEGVDMDRQAAKQKSFLTMVTGGPNRYTGRDMRAGHAHLVRLGLNDSHVDAVIESAAYRAFYMHGTGHWLGRDVHDVGDYRIDGEFRELEPGMVMTVEPGLYIAADEKRVPAKWRGIGVRIEDDVVVTRGEPDVLTSAVPKDPDEIERLMSR